MRNSALSAQPLFKHEHGCRIAPGPTKQTNTSVARSGKNTSTRFETSGNPGGSHFYARRVPHSDAHSRCLAAAIHRRHGGVQVVGVREEPRSVAVRVVSDVAVLAAASVWGFPNSGRGTQSTDVRSPIGQSLGGAGSCCYLSLPILQRESKTNTPKAQ